MAGNYPDVPAPRMAYDRDGTVGFRISTSNVVTFWSQGDLNAANNESTNNNTSAGPGRNTYQGLIFPQLRDISGIFCAAAIVNNGSYRSVLFEWSPNTTNGFDGTWNSLTTIGVNTTVISPYRDSITSVSQTGVKGIRTRASSFTGATDGWHYWIAVHFYGSISNYTGLDSLRMWHPTLDEPLDDNTSADGAYLDWGDVARGTSAARTFRIKNNSATLTANSVTLSTQVLSNTTPALEAQITYSDGGAFASSINIGNLAPGAMSSVITVRKNTDLSASPSLWAWRTVAEAGSWS